MVRTPMLGAVWSRRPSGDSHFPGKFGELRWCDWQRKRERKEGRQKERKETKAAMKLQCVDYPNTLEVYKSALYSQEAGAHCG